VQATRARTPPRRRLAEFVQTPLHKPNLTKPFNRYVVSGLCNAKRVVWCVVCVL
jgi:hypothetical protein